MANLSFRSLVLSQSIKLTKSTPNKTQEFFDSKCDNIFKNVPFFILKIMLKDNFFF